MSLRDRKWEGWEVSRGVGGEGSMSEKITS